MISGNVKDDKEDIVQNVETHFSCPICLNIVFEAVECEKCRQLYCQECVIGLLKCSVCQAEPFVLNPNHNVRKFTGNLKTDCKNDGCFERPTRSNLEMHVQKCPFSFIKCTSVGCDQNVKRVDLTQHLMLCDFVESQCLNHGCQMKFNRRDMSSHMKECRFALIVCPVCHLHSTREKVFVHVIENHYQEYVSRLISLIE